MKIAEVMTSDPKSLSPDAGLEEALACLAEGHIRHVPVVEGKRVVGIVSDRDLLAATGGVPERATGHTLREIMHVSPVTARPEDTLVTAAIEMGVRKLGCLPVVDRDHRLVGILTDTDLMRVFVRASREGLLSGDHDPEVAECMSHEPRALTPDVTLELALGYARAQDFRHLPVLRSDRVIGIVSDRDLCRELGRGTLPGHRVEDMMTRNVTTVSPSDSLTRAADLMIEHKISGLPVTERGILVGILSSTDLAEHCLNTLWEA